MKPKKPATQEQLNEFTRSLHTPPFWQGEDRHSLMSVHVSPSPENPGRHKRVRDPAVLEQVADAWQLPFAVWHSFTSLQVKPFPV